MKKTLLFGFIFLILISSVSAYDLTWLHDAADNDAAGINAVSEFVHITITTTGSNETFTIDAIAPLLARGDGDDSGTLVGYVSTDNTSYTQIGTFDISTLNTTPTRSFSDFNGSGTLGVTSGAEYYIKFNISSCGGSGCAVSFYGINPATSIMEMVYDAGTGEQSRDQNIDLAIYDAGVGGPENNLTVAINSSFNETTNINFTVEVEGYGNYSGNQEVVTDILLNAAGNYNISVWNILENNRPYVNYTKTEFVFSNSSYIRYLQVEPYYRINASDGYVGDPILYLTAKIDDDIDGVYDYYSVNTVHLYIPPIFSSFEIMPAHRCIGFDNDYYPPYTDQSENAYCYDDVGALYETKNVEIGSEYDYELILYSPGINITFYDSLTGLIIDDRDINFDLISDDYADNFSTNNGNKIINLTTSGTYNIRYSAENYTTRNYVYERNSTMDFLDTNISLYMVADDQDTAVEITVIDQNGIILSDVEVRSLRYYLPTNSYILQESSITNEEGKVIHTLTLNDEYYRFQIIQNDNILKSTTPSYITSNTLTIQVDTSDVLGISYANNYLSISSDLTFNENTNNTRLEYGGINNTGTEMCLTLYQFSSFENTLINTSCSTNNSAVLLLPVYNVNDINHRAVAIIDQTIFIDEIFIYKESPGIGTSGLLLQLLLTLTAIGFGLFNVGVALILAPLSLIVGYMLGLHTINIQGLIILQFILVVITVFMNTER